MAGGISIHVFDVSRGIAAAGLRVELRGPGEKMLAAGRTSAQGTFECPTPATGLYEMQVRYANGTTATAGHQVSVNGTAQGTVSYPPTGGWAKGMRLNERTLEAASRTPSSTPLATLTWSSARASAATHPAKAPPKRRV